MTTTYFGIFANGDDIEDISLETIANIEDVVYILRKQTEGFNQPTTYKLIDRDGKEYCLTIGNFKLLHIGTSGQWSEYSKRDIKIKDTRLDEIYNYKAYNAGVKFFHNEILPLLDKLHEIGSWEMHEKLRELEDANKTIELLNAKIARLESQLAEH